MSNYKNNVNKFQRLKRDFDEIKSLSDENIIETKDGNKSAKIDGKLLHSAYNPIQEAKQMISTYKIDDAPLIIVGFGFGYHVRELLNLYPGRKLLVVERNLKVLKKAFELFDFSNLSGDVKFFTGDNTYEIITDTDMYNALHKNPTIIVHKPSTFTSIKFYQNLTDSILSINKFKLGERIKISVVSPLYGGSVSISDYVCHSLKELGVSVDYIDNTIHNETYQEITNKKCDKEELVKSKAAFYRFLTDNIEQRVNYFKPDLVFALAQAPMSVGLLNKFYENGVKTAFWFVENFRHLTYWRYMAAYYDYFFTIQEGEFFEQLENIGVRNHYYLPMGAAPKIHKKESISNFEYDLSFVGAGYKNRIRFFDSILKKNPNLPISIWGNEWPKESTVYSKVKEEGNRLSTNEMFDIYRKSKIVINIHSSVNYASSMPKVDCDYLNPRTFELAAMGVFQLIDHRELIGDFFEIGKEIITFKDEKEFLEKSEYYLKNDLERNEIALNAKMRVLSDHSYEKRLTKMLTQVFGVGVLKSLGLKTEETEKQKSEKTGEIDLVKENDTINEDVALDKLAFELLKEQNKN